LPPRMRPASVDTFFDNWIYSTGIPVLKLSYSAKGAAPSVRISGKIEQSGVDDDFSIEAPVEIDFAKAPSQTVWVETSSAGAAFSTTVRQVPTRVSIPIGAGILARK
jgi:aminopeptidase N